MERPVPPGSETPTQSATSSPREEPGCTGAEVNALQEVGDARASRSFPESAEVEETTEPWAEGACRFDLSREEWQLVHDAPLLAFVRVAATDGQVHEWERRALVRALKEGRRSPSKVLRMVCVELYRERNALPGLLVTTELRLERLTEAYRLLEQKLGRDEAECFKEGLLKLGQRVASASGGLLAAWGLLPSAEREALEELVALLEAGRG